MVFEALFNLLIFWDLCGHYIAKVSFQNKLFIPSSFAFTVPCLVINHAGCQETRIMDKTVIS